MLLSKNSLLALLVIYLVGVVRASELEDDMSDLRFGVDDLIENKDFALEESDPDISGFEDYDMPKIKKYPAPHISGKSISCRGYTR